MKYQLEDRFDTLRSREVKDFLRRHGCGIHFQFKPAYASHFRGVFEIMIRSTFNVLDLLLEQHATQPAEESLETFI